MSQTHHFIPSCSRNHQSKAQTWEKPVHTEGFPAPPVDPRLCINSVVFSFGKRLLLRPSRSSDCPPPERVPGRWRNKTDRKRSKIKKLQDSAAAYVSHEPLLSRNILYFVHMYVLKADIFRVYPFLLVSFFILTSWQCMWFRGLYVLILLFLLIFMTKSIRTMRKTWLKSSVFMISLFRMDRFSETWFSPGLDSWSFGFSLIPSLDLV